MRNLVQSTAVSNGASADSVVVLAGLSNVYTHYITTFEEYQGQRYNNMTMNYWPFKERLLRSVTPMIHF